MEISPQQFQNIETEVNGLNKIFCIIRPSIHGHASAINENLSLNFIHPSDPTYGV